MLNIWKLDSSVDGYRVDIWNDKDLIPYKENPETRLEALEIILHNIQREIIKEEQNLRKAMGLI
jgi:hypothetical protein